MSLNWEPHDNVVAIRQKVMERSLEAHLEARYHRLGTKLVVRAALLALAAQEVVRSNAIRSSIISLEAAVNEWHKGVNEAFDVMEDMRSGKA